MAQTHLELIESLGLAMSWLQKELKWGVPATELPHLCGRIGELYAAVITNGQMAERTNEHGYDVVAGDGRKISIKTTAMTGSSGHVSFNQNTLHLADSVMVFCLDTQEMQIDTLFDGTVDQLRSLVCAASSGRLDLALSKVRKPKVLNEEKLKIVATATFEDYVISELENGSIRAVRLGEELEVVLPALRKLASHLGLPTVNENGNPYNTRSLGSQVIKTINTKNSV